MATLLITGCSKDDSQLPKAEIENLSGTTTVSQGTTVNLRAKVTSELEYTISWSVNNQVIAGAVGETFDFMSYQPDTYVVKLTVVNSDGTDTDQITITVNNDLYLIDFEASGVLPYVATSNSGTGVYDGGYTDTGSGLKMPASVNLSWGSWSGIAISQYNDIVTEGYDNQLSSYYKDVTSGFGGYNGSKTFAVSYSGTINFESDATESTFDHFWVTNNTYAALSMKNGDAYAKKFGLGDWFKLTVTAVDKSNNPTGSAVEVYLADFRTATSSGILTQWKMVDLKPLGNKVHAITFTLTSSDVGDWGMNTPAYFCFDNLAIKK